MFCSCAVGIRGGVSNALSACDYTILLASEASPPCRLNGSRCHDIYIYICIYTVRRRRAHRPSNCACASTFTCARPQCLHSPGTIYEANASCSRKVQARLAGTVQRNGFAHARYIRILPLNICKCHNPRTRPNGLWTLAKNAKHSPSIIHASRTTRLTRSRSPITYA